MEVEFYCYFYTRRAKNPCTWKMQGKDLETQINPV